MSFVNVLIIMTEIYLLMKKISGKYSCDFINIYQNLSFGFYYLLLAKKVTNMHKKLTLEDRENNFIIFISLRDIKDDDSKIFNQMFSQSHGFVNAPKVSTTRLEAKSSNCQRPLKVSFQERWDKSKFFAKLYNLKLDEKLITVV